MSKRRVERHSDKAYWENCVIKNPWNRTVLLEISIKIDDNQMKLKGTTLGIHYWCSSKIIWYLEKLHCSFWQTSSYVLRFVKYIQSLYWTLWNIPSWVRPSRVGSFSTDSSWFILVLIKPWQETSWLLIKAIWHRFYKDI